MTAATDIDTDEAAEATPFALRTVAERLADKVAGHRSEVAYGANVGRRRAKSDRRAFSRADRRAARAACRAAL